MSKTVQDMAAVTIKH